MTQQKSRLRGWDLSGEIRAGFLISIPASDVQNGWMATHLVTERYDFGPLGFRAQLAHPASQPARLDPSWIQPVWVLPGGLRAKMVRTSRAESWVRNSPADPADSPDPPIPRKWCQELRFRPCLTTRRGLRMT